MANWIRHPWTPQSTAEDRITWYETNIPGFSTWKTNNIVTIDQSTANKDIFIFQPTTTSTNYVTFTLQTLNSATSAAANDAKFCYNRTSSSMNSIFTSAMSRVSSTYWPPTESNCPLYIDTLALDKVTFVRVTFEQIRSFVMIGIFNGKLLENNTDKTLIYIGGTLNSASYPADASTRKSGFAYDDGGTGQETTMIQTCVPYIVADDKTLTKYIVNPYYIGGIDAGIYTIAGPASDKLPPFMSIVIDGQEYMTLGQRLVVPVTYPV